MKVFDCVDHNKLENFQRDGNNSPPYLSPQKPVCGSRNNKPRHVAMGWFKIGKRVWQGCILSPCLFNLHTELCRVDHMKCWGGWLTDWNQDCQEKYQQPQIRRWYPSTGRKWRKTKELLDKSERGERKSWLKINIQKTKIMSSSPINFMTIRWENSGNSDRLHILGHQNHCKWWLQPWN